MSTKSVCVVFLNADGTYDVALQPGADLKDIIDALEHILDRKTRGEKPESAPPPLVIRGEAG